MLIIRVCEWLHLANLAGSIFSNFKPEIKCDNISNSSSKYSLRGLPFNPSGDFV